MENDFDKLISWIESGVVLHKASTIVNGIIIEGAKQSVWTVEDIVAEAYDREIINPEKLSWADAVEYVKKATNGHTP